jgi:hypothetical protein
MFGTVSAGNSDSACLALPQTSAAACFRAVSVAGHEVEVASEAEWVEGVAVATSERGQHGASDSWMLHVQTIFGFGTRGMMGKTIMK